MTTGGEVVVQVDRVLPSSDAVDLEPEGHDAPLLIRRVRPVEVTVLPIRRVVRELIEVDRGVSERRRRHGARRDPGRLR